jgi:hypothetical protein
MDFYGQSHGLTELRGKLAGLAPGKLGLTVAGVTQQPC